MRNGRVQLIVQGCFTGHAASRNGLLFYTGQSDDVLMVRRVEKPDLPLAGMLERKWPRGGKSPSR